MIPPTVGRVVWFYPASRAIGDQPLIGIVARVWTNVMVNLAVFDKNGKPTDGETSVHLLQDETPRPEGGAYCEWMPYQIGQAKKEA